MVYVVAITFAGIDIGAIAVAAAVMTGLAVFFAAVLLAADRFLAVEEDPRIDRIEEILPAANCGACGFPGCRAYAEAVAGNRAPPDKCAPGGSDVAERIAEIMGARARTKEPRYAVVHCGAGESERVKQAVYDGPKTCAAADWTGGENACKYGCLGYGDCAEACPFDAITLVDGLPKIDLAKCTGCGSCVAACPRNIITLEKFDTRFGRKTLVTIACSSKEKGATAKKSCPVACIGCKSCEKLFPEVFKIEDFLAVIDYDAYEYETGDYLPAVEKCPTNCIRITE